MTNRTVLISGGSIAGLTFGYCAGQRRGRAAISHVFADLNPDTDAATATAVARMYFALLNGLAITWLIDPEQTATAEDLGLAVHALAQDTQEPKPPG